MNMHSKEMLKSICDDIELISGIQTVIYDENKTVIHSQLDAMSDFCAKVRTSKALTEKCFSCDKAGLKKCEFSRDLHIYQCHMGLYEAVAPIIENGHSIGYLMLGQILLKGTRDTVLKKIDELTEDVDKAMLRESLDSLSETDEAHMRAAARILAMSASYVRLHELMKQEKSSIRYEIESFVFSHIEDEGLTTKFVCASLGLSRTALYKICKASLGIGMSEYIHKIRASHAVNLLKSTNLQISEVAEKVGLTQSSLSRLLKNQFGKSAKEIRKG